MTYRMKLGIALLVVGLGGVVAAQSPAKPVRIRGEIAAVTADSLTVKRRSGDTVVVTLNPELTVSAVKNVPLAEVKPNTYVGVASMAGEGNKRTAIEVLVFPEAGRGTGEGHFDWDLGNNSMMTNANVDTAVQGVNGRTLTLSYKGGTQEITVPEDAPVVTIIPATKADLVAGKKVFVVGTPTGRDDNFRANRVVVEKDGVAPPM
ncbi:hypothetical protein FXN63_05495 [Pigmentiphaga aceris]|uniref:DUF5666 domain-containing protein n=1 Tax=Pigmentiphaga aceris TaxID=1940612 RepID=A0A5C0AUG5_9BURK|nr:hypothetical protein [Pigmentiphaga aceris]QEI05356.1 hypothetical protein FXN63_05495 [Pigmentiphaga aceris]